MPLSRRDVLEKSLALGSDRGFRTLPFCSARCVGQADGKRPPGHTYHVHCSIDFAQPVGKNVVVR
jgi:hypothetical protein